MADGNGRISPCSHTDSIISWAEPVRDHNRREIIETQSDGCGIFFFYLIDIGDDVHLVDGVKASRRPTVLSIHHPHPSILAWDNNHGPNAKRKKEKGKEEIDRL